MSDRALTGQGRPRLVAAERIADRSRARLIEDIERLCSDAGISLLSLARAAGVPYSHLWRIMAGRASPSLETYAKLAVPLGADLVTRLYPNTGPLLRDRHQARILEHLLTVLDPRWHPFTEVSVSQPARGWIDLVLHEPRERVVVAAEIESDIRRIEQQVRWSRLKADSLGSWRGWPDIASAGAPAPSVSRLLVVRRTRKNAGIAHDFGTQLALAYPAHPEDAIAALTGRGAWPGPALVWVQLDAHTIRLLERRRSPGQRPMLPRDE